MAPQTYRVHVEFIEPLLGTVALNEEVYRDYILKKASDAGKPLQEVEDELETIPETVDEALDKGTTGFHVENGVPVLYDYAYKGFFKESCSMLARADGTLSKQLKAFKKVIDGLVFVTPRRIPIVLSGPLGVLERPLRASTAKGERITLARSQTAPIGSTMDFTVLVLGSVTEELLIEWLEYGALHGMGSWRSASWGRFSHTLRKA